MTLPTDSELVRRARQLVELDHFGDQPVYLVGGAVRDLLTGCEPADIDLAVEGSLKPVLTALEGAVDAYDRFATATVVRGGRRYDVAQTRAEAYAYPGALPDVRPAGILEDLRRRDFTVNAIAVALAGPRAGEVLYADGAREDLQAGRLEVLHDRSFEDDPTRLLRLARYQARLQFEIGERTERLARAAVGLGAINTVSGTRVGNELRLLAAEPDPVAALNALAELGLGWGVNPETADRAIAALPDDGRRDLVTLAAALLDRPVAQTAPLLDKLAFTAADRDAISEAAARARPLAVQLATAGTGSEIAHAAGNLGITTVCLACALGDATRARRWLEDLRHRTLQISGADLLAAGVPEGPRLGVALAAARDAMWNDHAEDRDRQLAVALAAAE